MDRRKGSSWVSQYVYNLFDSRDWTDDAHIVNINSELNSHSGESITELKRHTSSLSAMSVMNPYLHTTQKSNCSHLITLRNYTGGKDIENTNIFPTTTFIPRLTLITHGKMKANANSVRFMNDKMTSGGVNEIPLSVFCHYGTEWILYGRS